LSGWRQLHCRTEGSDGAFPCKSFVCCRFVYGQCENGGVVYNLGQLFIDCILCSVRVLDFAGCL